MLNYELKKYLVYSKNNCSHLYINANTSNSPQIQNPQHKIAEDFVNFIFIFYMLFFVEEEKF